MNRLEQIVSGLPASMQPLWWQIIHDNLKLSGHSPLVMSQWLNSRRQQITDYNLELGMRVAIHTKANSVGELWRCFTNPARAFANDTAWEQWKRKELARQRLERMDNGEV